MSFKLRHMHIIDTCTQKVTENGITTVKEYDNEHGICVVGGSLQSTARFNIDFRGLYNGYDQSCRARAITSIRP